jgi:tRNA threonylcarbamoyladenosine biosynthesis protein TsaB
MFTSLRVGLSVAKGSALSLGLPLKGVSTLDALVRTANREPRTAHREPPTHTADWLVPLIDARKGEVYAALYRGGEHMADFLIINPRQVASAVIELTSSSPQPSPLRGEGETGKNSNRRFLLLGTGARRYRNELAETFGTSAEFLELDYPSPEVIAFEARDRIEHGEADSLNDLSPLYLRRTDAELRRDGHPSSPQPSPQRGEGEKSTLPNAH